MIRAGVLAGIAVTVVAGCSGGAQLEEAGASGQALFVRHCAGCHPDGKNVIYPQKDLRAMTLAANGITKPEDIIAVMRNPGRGMPRFDQAVIADGEALRVAVYVLETFR
jgi:cytochrome c6